jgi:ELWxxDGT repeat protein
MKKTLHLLLAALSTILLAQQLVAQATLVSNNTYINTGFILPANNKPIMEDTTGAFWTTDGATAYKFTTAVTHPITLGSAFFNNKIYFGGTDAITKDTELWASDGTATGTQLIANINPAGSSTPDQFFVFNNTLYFTANDGSHGRELWKSNGTIGNAILVADINAGAADGICEDACFFQNDYDVFFPAKSAAGSGLWKIDLTAPVPTLVRNITGTISLRFGNRATLGSKTVFDVRTGNCITGNTQLWATDGTGTGTQMLRDFGMGSGSVPLLQLTPFNGLLFFDGFGSNGVGLWTTDGTATNTRLFMTNGPSSPFLLSSALINGKMYFSGSTTANGRELWITDGTLAGTGLFKDINSGVGDASPKFLFNIGASVNWKSTGLIDYNFQKAYSTPFLGKWYFTADDGIHGQELWSTDGTATGTQMVKDVNPGAGAGVTIGRKAYYTATGIYYVGNNGISGEEPFFTDGTADGTRMVADINPNPGAGSDPEYLFFFDNQIYLDADNGDVNHTDSVYNPDLYKIDPAVVLAVKLFNFNVVLRGGDIEVDWATSGAMDTKSFAVERSTDAVHFSTVGTVAAAGNGNTTQQYRFTDANAPKTGATVLYYRLCMTDNDGKYAYSAIMPVQLNAGMLNITLSPNPVHDQLAAVFSTNNAKAVTLKITDVNGKVFYRQQFQVNGVTSRQQSIDVSKYVAGTYYLQLITGKDKETVKFIKQ